MSSGVIMEYRNTVLIILAIYLFTINSAGLGIKLLAWFILWYGTGGKYWIYLAKYTLKRDLRRVQCCQIYLLGYGKILLNYKSVKIGDLLCSTGWRERA
jgi:hypothetical protein